MSDFDFSSIGKSSAYLKAEAAKQSTNTQNSLNQEDFLKLLTTQLTNQDPTSPVDNNQMVTTMSQLSIVDNLNSINSGMENVVSAISSSSALSASSLVGRSVLVDSNTAFYDGQTPVTAKINAGDGMSDINIRVYSPDGTLAGAYQANAGDGQMDFAWDGLDADGEPLNAGMYTIRATGVAKDGSTQSLAVSTYATVGSVTLGSTPSETSLNLIGYGDVALSDVQEIAL